MSTASKPTTARTTPHGTCRCTLTINGARYALRPVPADRRAPGVVKAFSLVHERGTRLVELLAGGAARCSCEDAKYRGRERACKHVGALVALGIL